MTDAKRSVHRPVSFILMTNTLTIEALPTGVYKASFGEGCSILIEDISTIENSVAGWCQALRMHYSWEAASKQTDLAKENESLRKTINVALGLILKHHKVGVQQELGCFCPVCHHEDGTEPELDAIHKALFSEANVEVTGDPL